MNALLVSLWPLLYAPPVSPIHTSILSDTPFTVLDAVAAVAMNESWYEAVMMSVSRSSLP